MAKIRTLYKNVYIRDKWRCKHCRNSIGLHPHHVIHRGQGGKDLMNNLITLCWKCHAAHHDGFLEIKIIDIKSKDVIVSFTRKRGWKPNK